MKTCLPKLLQDDNSSYGKTWGDNSPGGAPGVIICEKGKFQPRPSKL